MATIVSLRLNSLQTTMRPCWLSVCAALLLPVPSVWAATPAASAPQEVVVVGAGVAGLSAAIEAADRGAHVTIIDMASVFGGHAVMSSGDVTIAGTPFQKQLGIVDSPERLLEDLNTWGEDPNPFWARRYAENAVHEVYDWLTAMGVSFDLKAKRLPQGNSVPRLLATVGRGMGFVTPLFHRVLRHRSIGFLWNTRVTGLMLQQKKVVGVKTFGERTKKSSEVHSSAVILATGGFQSNLDLVRKSWPKETPFPQNMLVGSGINSQGTGLALAQSAQGAVTGLDRQWNYASGIPDPSHPEGSRGVSVRLWDAVWVNERGERFVNEHASQKDLMQAVVVQPNATSWAILDDIGKRQFFVAGTGWEAFEKFESLILRNLKLTTKAASVEDLANGIGVDPTKLAATIQRYNKFVARGNDADFSRFPNSASRHLPARIHQPPFYAVRLFPLSRKSMGGIVIDHDARVVSTTGVIIPGLYAAGEVTGLAGINGKAALEGTFLAPSVLTGRAAGRTAMSDLGQPNVTADLVTETPVVTAPTEVTKRPNSSCLGCHPLQALVTAHRPGYAHFEAVHTRVLDRNLVCNTCHAEFSMVPGMRHKIDRMAQSMICPTCHAAAD